MPTPRYAFKVTTLPAIEPVTVQEVKDELGITDDATDARLLRLISLARALAEGYTGRAFITQTITLQLDCFPAPHIPWWDGVVETAITAFGSTSPIPLPRPPAVSVTSVKWYDTTDTLHTMPAADYRLDTLPEPALLYRAGYGMTWPIDTRPDQAVLIEYVAGYGSSPMSVPAAIREAIVLHVRDTWERPNAGIGSESIDNASTSYWQASTAPGRGGNPGGLRGGANLLLDPFRVTLGQGM